MARSSAAQAIPTASAAVRISMFAGFSGTYTGLTISKNAGLTGGVDIGIRPFATFYPALEVRGTYPTEEGKIVGLRNVQAGLRVGRRSGPFSGYGDVLFGRGQLNYLSGGIANPSGTLLFDQTTSNVLSLGGGADWDWTEHLGLKGDFQFQKYATPVTESGNLFSKVFTAAVVYRFGSRTVR